MTDQTALGARVHVTSADGKEDLGFGTYLGEHDLEIEDSEPLRGQPWILLDSGKIATGIMCWWEEAPDAPPASSLVLILEKNITLRDGQEDGGILGPGYFIALKGGTIGFDAIQVVEHDGKPKVALRCTEDKRCGWAIVIDMKLPFIDDPSA